MGRPTKQDYYVLDELRRLAGTAAVVCRVSCALCDETQEYDTHPDELAEVLFNEGWRPAIAQEAKMEFWGCPECLKLPDVREQLWNEDSRYSRRSRRPVRKTPVEKRGR